MNGKQSNLLKLENIHNNEKTLRITSETITISVIFSFFIATFT